MALFFIFREKEGVRLKTKKTKWTLSNPYKTEKADAKDQLIARAEQDIYLLKAEEHSLLLEIVDKPTYIWLLWKHIYLTKKEVLPWNKNGLKVMIL